MTPGSLLAIERFFPLPHLAWFPRATTLSLLVRHHVGQSQGTRKTKTAFDMWWSALPLEVRQINDLAFARRCFRAGHVAGAKPGKSKFIFLAGRLVVSVWATNSKDAARDAAIELDYRMAKAGKRPPATGWKLTPVADNA
ncbi:hypothetical protein [Rhizobium brockwellii]